LLLEELSFSEAFEKKLHDGFDQNDSPYYSRKQDGSEIRLLRFTNKFESKICLYKLHGSLDNFVFNFKDNLLEEVKIPYGVSLDYLSKKTRDKNGELKDINCYWLYYPDFLTGVIDKADHYEESCYYKPIFDNFKFNLENSSTLIVIGYSFQDYKINDILKNHFLKDTSKRMIFISPKLPDNVLLQNNNVRYYGNGLGVQDITNQKIRELLI
jgi:hypothetical protein